VAIRRPTSETTVPPYYRIIMITYLKERIASFRYAFVGMIEVIRSQANPKIHLVASLIVILGGWYLVISTEEWCLVILCITSVLGAESLNSAIEYLTDLVSPEFHPLAKKTKDAAAAGVLWVAIGAFFIGMIIFLPKIIGLF